MTTLASVIRLAGISGAAFRPEVLVTAALPGAFAKRRREIIAHYFQKPISRLGLARKPVGDVRALFAISVELFGGPIRPPKR